MKIDGLGRYAVAHVRVPKYSAELFLSQLDEDISVGRSHIHQTNFGDAIPLYRMEDEHLMNTIAYHSRGLANMINNGGNLSKQETMLDAVMEGRTEIENKVSKAKEAVSAGYAILGRYMVEAMRRGEGEKAMKFASEYFDAVNMMASLRPTGEVIKQDKGGENDD